ncbi:hypothetical protein [Thermaurantiacus sp.]
MSSFPPLPATARGPRPKAFDQNEDILVAMLLELARELWVTRSRLAALEHWAASEVPAARTPWSEAYRLPPDVEAELAAARDAFVSDLLAPIERL